MNKFTIELSPEEIRTIWKTLGEFVEECDGVNDEVIGPDDAEHLDVAKDLMFRLRDQYKKVQIAPYPPEFGFW